MIDKNGTGPAAGGGAPKAFDEALGEIERVVLDAPVAGKRDGTGATSATETPDVERPAATGRKGREKPKRERRVPEKNKMLAIGADDLDLWRDANGDGYVSFANTVGVREHAPITSRAFANHLRLQSLAATGDVPSSPALEEVVRLHGARALLAPVHEPILRVGVGPGDTIVIDKGAPAGDYFSVSRHGFQTLHDGAPKFVRRRGMTSLCEPEPGSSVSLLRPFVNCEGETDFSLIVGWLLQALRPVGAYPILVISGEQGAGKSVLTKMLRRFCDPSAVAISAPPRDMRDYLVTATNSRVIAIDNVSKLDAELSDTMCRLSTGAGNRVRALFSDTEESLFMGARPQIVNGIGALAERADLADRVLTVNLKAIPDTGRQSEHDVWRAFDRVEASIFGALLTGVSHGLRNFETTRLDRTPRLADFARWIVACEPGLGDDWAPGTFLGALDVNRDDARAAAFESDIVAGAIDKFVRADRPEGWSGTATDLLTAISARASDDLKRRKDWPYSAQGLGNRLDRAAPLLRARGLLIERRHSGQRFITINLANHQGETNVAS